MRRVPGDGAWAPAVWARAMGLAVATLVGGALGADDVDPGARGGIFPVDGSGRPLNFGFETGTLDDWTASGPGFDRGVVAGDAVNLRRGDMHSRHAGGFWVNSFEGGKGDDVKGTLTSAPFVVARPFASFLIGGGAFATTRVEVVRKDTGKVVAVASGDSVEDMHRVAVDLAPHLGKEAFVRLVDDQVGGWGHVNFDDFRLHDAKPEAPLARLSAPPDVFQNAGLPPAEAAAAMTVPEGFKVTLFAGEPEVHQPIALAIDPKGRTWVAEGLTYPIRQPEGKGRDRILIFEDTDGDGKADTSKVFAEGLNLVSGFELGFGGVFLGAAPNLLFLADADGDDKADGPPTVLLDGWGLQDTHETLNTFTWGPDGWLYGCQGVFTESKVGTPGTSAADRQPINGGIWRYHPTRKVFEVVAHGTSNPWGYDFDERGRGFLTSCVIPHLYQVIPGGRYERQVGPHYDPSTYDDIKTIADHRHWVGGNPHGGNGRSDSAGGGHAHSGAMIYQGDAWPEEFRGSIFMNNIHGARINRDTLTPKGSGFVGGHAPDFLLANDSWSQVLNLKAGPDGNVTMIDWYDGQQCHLTDPARHDRSNGRIFRVVYAPPGLKRKARVADVNTLSSLDLVKLLSDRNEWHSRTARHLLQQRGEANGPAVREALTALAFSGPTEHDRLRGLWALHSTGGLTPELLVAHITEGTPAEIGWKVRLGAESRAPSPALLAKYLELASASAGSPEVRLELAAALQRMPLADRWPIVAALLAHGEDAGDMNLPLMIWFGSEPLAPADPGRFLALALAGKIPTVRDFAIRRVGSIGTPEAIARLVDAIPGAGPGDRLALLRGLNTSLKGRRQVEMPPRWPAVYAELAADPAARSEATALGLTFGDDSARAELRAVAVDPKADPALRTRAVAALLRAKDPGLAPTLQRLAGSGSEADAPLRGEAIRGLAGYDDARTPDVILGLYPKLAAEERRDALNTLATRPASARALLAAVGDGRVRANELSADLVRQLRNLDDPEVNDRIAKSWGSARPTTADRSKAIEGWKARLARKPATPPDPALGHAVFARSCGQCHTLFDAGGKVGPELTGSNRRDADYILSNLLDPSALIGKDYLAHVVATTDGRVLTGIVRAEDKDAITLVTANEVLTIPLGEVEGRKPSETSMMPEDLLNPLSDHEARSLFAYLASPAQTPRLATPGDVPALFNGRDLAGWAGDPTLWSVEAGELVGRTTTGLARNEFLRSSLMAADFRLSVEIKLVKDEGNSGIQFRSESLPDGEVKGDQADVGPGWWGKLYEEHGRGLLWDKSGESAVRKGDWNRYVIEAVGPRVVTTINGQPCVTIDDPAGARRGIFALQLHSGGPTEVRYRDFKLEVLPTPPR